jgi:hypothetical protein
MPEVRRARTHGPPIYNKIKNLNKDLKENLDKNKGDQQ